MTSKTKKKFDARTHNEKQSRFKALLRESVIFIIGTLFGLYVVQWFVTLLPGPHISATIQGLHGTSGNAIGCTYYNFSLITDDPIEYVYAKAQLPNHINNFKVGFPQETEINKNQTAMQAWEAGKDSKGECVIVQAAVNNDADVQFAAVGNTIVIHSSKLAPKAMIVGLVATADQRSALPIYTEGAYEYLKLGQAVRKPLPILDTGTSDMK